MEKVRDWIRRKPITWVAVSAAVLLVVAFVGGSIAADDSSEVSDLKSELASTSDGLESAEGAQENASSEAEELQEELFAVEDELTAERSLNGNAAPKQKAAGEYDTDFPWEGAGTVGYLTMKPIAFERSGEAWILTVEAKNEGSEPKQPFCGGAEGVVIDAEDNNYTGEAVLGESSDNCGEDLQPGLTGNFKSEFKLPAGAVPVGVALYGDYEQEDEAKTWELPQ